MKSKLLNVLALAAVLMSVSCSEDDPAKPVDFSAPEKQATIQGQLLINADLTLDDEVYSAAPAGTTIRAVVAYNDLGSTASGSYTTTATVDSKGVFELKVPASDGGVTVSLTVNDIKGKQKDFTGETDDQGITLVDSQGKALTAEENGVWSFSFSAVASKLNGVVSGQVVILPSVVGTFAEEVSVGSPVI
jgi:hypothetical protein